MNKEIRDMTLEELLKYAKSIPTTEKDREERVVALATGMARGVGDDVSVEDMRVIYRIIKGKKLKKS